MRVLVLAVGRMKKGAEADLADRYLKRATQAGRAIGIRAIEIGVSKLPNSKSPCNSASPSGRSDHSGSPPRAMRSATGP